MDGIFPLKGCNLNLLEGVMKPWQLFVIFVFCITGCNSISNTPVLTASEANLLSDQIRTPSPSFTVTAYQKPSPSANPTVTFIIPRTPKSTPIPTETLTPTLSPTLLGGDQGVIYYSLPEEGVFRLPVSDGSSNELILPVKNVIRLLNGNNGFYFRQSSGMGCRIETGTNKTKCWDGAWNLSPDETYFLKCPWRQPCWIGTFEDGSILEIPAYNGSWSPNSEKIAFLDSKDIFILDVNDILFRSKGKIINKQQLTIDGGWYENWSPNGNQIAFIRGGHENGDVFIMDDDGNNQTQITFSYTSEFAPVWSPNGQYVAFLANYATYYKPISDLFLFDVKKMS